MVEATEEKMRWLVVGGDGQLGRSMQQELREQSSEFMALNRDELDISDAGQVSTILHDLKPEVVFNAAAWTNVDAAEDAEIEATRINVAGAGNLARASSEIAAKFVYISTDYVFSGSNMHPWDEESQTCPSSAYGRTKVAGEKLVKEIYPEGTFIVRTAWLYGQFGRNFAKTMVKKAIYSDDQVGVVSDQFGQPTFTGDLVRQVRELVEGDSRASIYHGTNSGRTNWYEFTKSIFELVGEDIDRVEAINSSDYPSRVIRPTNSVLGHERWRESGLSPMRNWRLALEEAMPLILESVKIESMAE